MLQRTANNSNSWWYASHIRTKQSKWLDQSLQDMEDTVQSMLKLIEQDGDSFAKRAEMYYKRRPELINSVEEAYRVFRALAERYDKLSNELHTANHTIATVFPEQIQMSIEDNDDFGSPKLSKNLQFPLPANESGSPQFQKPQKKDLKPINTTLSKQFHFKKLSNNAEDANNTPPTTKSGLTKPEALKEIDKLQEEICSLQTVKEYVRSSYESGLAKFGEIEKQIVEMQQKVCRLMDEFGVGSAIDDEKTRNLMAKTALKSCQESLEELQEKHEKCAKDAKEESQKIKEADKKLESIKHEYLRDQTGEKDQVLKAENESQSSNQETGDVTEELQQKLDGNTNESLTVTELTIKIDEFVNKVINLEITVTSQTALIDRLSTESDDLQARIRSLEDDKATLTEDNEKLRLSVLELEEELKRVHNLNRDVEDQNGCLKAQLAEAKTTIDHLSEKLKTVKPDDQIEAAEENMVKKLETPNPVETGQNGEITKPEAKHVTFADSKTFEDSQQPKENESEKSPSLKSQPGAVAKELEKEEKFNWQKMLLNGVEDREKVLLKEYTTILRIYKDLKKKLDDMESKDKDKELESALQISEMKIAIANRDEEIHHLRQKLNRFHQFLIL